MGLRSTLLAAIAVLGALALFGARSPVADGADPPGAARHAAALAASLATADATLTLLEGLLGDALDDARGGAALVLSGDGAPEERFDAAALAVEAAGPSIAAAREALRQVARIGASSLPPLVVPELPIGAPDLARIGAELRATGATAASVAGLRHASDRVLQDLQQALIAASAERPDEIDGAVASARAGVTVVESWNDALPTLPVWTSGVTSLLDSLDGIATALRGADAAALAAARDAYDVAASEASRADRGLAIALADAAASIGGAPAILADALAQVSECRDGVASVVLEAAGEGAPS